MNKKGMVFWVFFGIIIGFTVLFYYAYVAKESADLSLFLKTKLARDFAIEINTLYAIPGNVYIQYPQNVSDYIVEIDKGIVRVYEQPLLIPSYPYAEFDEYNIEYTKPKKIDFLNFYKDNNKISFEQD